VADHTGGVALPVTARQPLWQLAVASRSGPLHELVRPAAAEVVAPDVPEDAPAPSNVLLPYLGLYVYLLLSMMRPQDWWGPMLGMPVDYVTFGFILLTGAATSDGLQRLVSVLTSQQARLILLYIFTALVSVVVNGGFDVLAERAMLLMQLFTVFVMFAAFSGGARRAGGLLMLIVSVAAILAYQGIDLVETGVGWAGQGLYWGGRIRWIGMYDGANVLCMLFILAIAFTLHFLLGPWSFTKRVLSIGAAVAIVYGVYLTQSRGGFLAFTIVVALTVILKRTDKPLQLSFGRVVAAAVLGMMVLGFAPARMEQLNDDSHSAAGRIDAWQEGLEMLKANPLLGIGDGLWLRHHRRLAHNSIVQTMGEMGIVGLTAWIAMLLGCTRLLLRVRVPERSARDRSLATSLLVGLAGFTACSYFVTTVQFDLTYILCGMALAVCGDRDRGDASLGAVQYVSCAAIGMMLITMTYVTVRIFYATT
jgi:putative inorganic carbon (hco3(-)) transporter